jgi:hypothetical protein
MEMEELGRREKVDLEARREDLEDFLVGEEEGEKKDGEVESENSRD